MADQVFHGGGVRPSSSVASVVRRACWSPDRRNRSRRRAPPMSSMSMTRPPDRSRIGPRGPGAPAWLWPWPAGNRACRDHRRGRPGARRAAAAAAGRAVEAARRPRRAAHRRTGEGRPRRTRSAHRRPILAGPRFADRQRPAFEGLAVESPNHFFGDGAIRELDEGESARTTGFAIYGQRHLRRGADFTEVLSKLRLVDAVIQVADEQPHAHGTRRLQGKEVPILHSLPASGAPQSATAGSRRRRPARPRYHAAMPLVPLGSLPDDARVWVFAAERALAPAEAEAGAGHRRRLPRRVGGARPAAPVGPRAARIAFPASSPSTRRLPAPPAAQSTLWCARSAASKAGLGVALVDHGPIVFREGGAIRRVPRDEFAELARAGRVTPGHGRLRQHHLAAGRPPAAAAGSCRRRRPGTAAPSSDPNHRGPIMNVTRREMLGTMPAAMAGAWALAGQGLAAPSGGAGLVPARLGVQLYTVRDQLEDARRDAGRHQGGRFRRGRDAAADPGRPAAAAEEARADARRAATSTPRSSSTSARLGQRRCRPATPSRPPSPRRRPST